MICATLLVVAPARGEPPPAPPPASPAGATLAPLIPGASVFSTEQLDQVVAPVALYPDALLMQVLVAATYPLEVVQANRWVRKNPDLKDAELDKALGAQRWDPSVKVLAHFPTVLIRIAEHLDWSKDLGDALLAQQRDVLEAIQRMRHKAYAAGSLGSTPEQTVVVEKAVPKDNGATLVAREVPPAIRIEPADLPVVYVPIYNSTVVYGPPPATVYYRAVMTDPPAYMATASLLSFGPGIAVGATFRGSCDWHNHSINVTENYNVANSKINRPQPAVWKHDPQHRRSVNYRSEGVAKQYGQADASNAAARQRARGFGNTGAPPAKGRDTAFGSLAGGPAERVASARGAGSRGVSGESFAGDKATGGTGRSAGGQHGKAPAR